MIFLRKMRERCSHTLEVFLTKRSKGALTLTAYSVFAGQAEAPMTAPEEGVPSFSWTAERLSSFGQKYLGGAEGGGKAPNPLAAGAKIKRCHA